MCTNAPPPTAIRSLAILLRGSTTPATTSITSPTSCSSLHPSARTRGTQPDRWRDHLRSDRLRPVPHQDPDHRPEPDRGVGPRLLVLFRMNVPPVISIHIPFGGDHQEGQAGGGGARDRLESRLADHRVNAHSQRSAAIGSMREARRAGTKQARSATEQSTTATETNVAGSAELMPYRLASRSRVSAHPPAAPRARPAPTIQAPSPMTRPRMSRGRAPSAMRSPISPVRWPTEYLITP